MRPGGFNRCERGGSSLHCRRDAYSWETPHEVFSSGGCRAPGVAWGLVLSLAAHRGGLDLPSSAPTLRFMSSCSFQGGQASQSRSSYNLMLPFCKSLEFRKFI